MSEIKDTYTLPSSPGNISMNSQSLPFSACSIIWRMAFFRLFALSINCSRGRNIWGRAVHDDDPTERSVEESQTLPEPSPSSVSSAMVGGGFGREVDAWDSSFNVFKRESSFSFKTQHYKYKAQEFDDNLVTNPSTHSLFETSKYLSGHNFWLLRTFCCLLIGLPYPSHKIFHSLTEHPRGKKERESSSYMPTI